MAESVPSVAPETVGFKNLELATGANNPGAIFVNAFMKGSEINRKRQQLEQQLQIAQLKNYTDQMHHANQMEHWQTQAAIKMQDILLDNKIANARAETYARNAETAALAVDVNQQKVNNKAFEIQRVLDDTSAFYTDWQGTGKQPGEAGYRAALSETLIKHPSFAQSKAGLEWQKASQDQSNLASNRLITANNALWTEFGQETAKKYFGGAYTDYSIFEHPEWWRPQYKDATGKVVDASNPKPVDKEGNYVDPNTVDPNKLPSGWTTTKQVAFDRGAQFAAPTNPSARWVTLPAAVVQRDRNRYRALVESRQKIEPQITDPGVGVYPQNPAGTAPAAPRDPAQRRKGQRYATPQGELVWTDQGWAR